MRRNFKRKVTGTIFIIAVYLVVSQSPAVEFAGGTGEPNDPYQIATAQQLISIGDDPILLEKHYALVNDIDLDPNLPGGQVFTKAVIALSPHNWRVFKGTLDGNGHTISNMVINSNYNNLVISENTGLIGYLDRDGIVKDIQLRNITIIGESSHVGALVGSNGGGMILRCSVTGSISGEHGVGGLVGENSGDIVSCSAFCNIQTTQEGMILSAGGGLAGSNGGNIYNCYSIGTVTGEEYLGGLVGYNYGYSPCISNCYAMSTVTGKQLLGGLVGDNRGFISNCYAIGTVAGEQTLGGLIGNNSSSATVSQCYAVCEIITDPNDSIGGLIGKSHIRAINTNSFWDIQVSCQKISAGGTGLTTAKLQDSKTFLDAGWDMASETSHGLVDIWTITEPNTYPQLTRLTDQYSITQLSGNGTPDDPYEIATAADLAAINDYDIKAHYILVADIDTSGMVWATAPIFLFDGTLDGQGHTISNLTIMGGNYLGLFSKIRTHGVLTNLTILDAYIIGNDYLGTIAGESFGHITNCHVTGSVTGVSFVGGLVGLAGIDFGSILEEYIYDCTADVALSGNDYVHNIATAFPFD